jgi:hypothetical protein
MVPDETSATSNRFSESQEICQDCVKAMAGGEKAFILTAMRLLIIDDDAELCQLVADYLKPMGFDVEMEHDGEH